MNRGFVSVAALLGLAILTLVLSVVLPNSGGTFLPTLLRGETGPRVDLKSLLGPTYPEQKPVEVPGQTPKDLITPQPSTPLPTATSTPLPAPGPTPVTNPQPSLTPQPISEETELKARVYWLVPAGQSPVAAFESGLPGLLEKTRQFFAGQLGGETFFVEGSITKVLSSHPPQWFYGCDSGECGYQDKPWREANIGNIWGRTREDLASKGIAIDTQNSFAVIILSPGTFQFGTGGGFGLSGNSTGGVAILGEQKTAGALGLHSTDEWCQPVEDQGCINQVVGSFIHEIGHGLGLPHPTNPTDQEISLMWSWWKYPNVGLTQGEKDKLLANLFIR